MGGGLDEGIRRKEISSLARLEAAGTGVRFWNLERLHAGAQGSTSGTVMQLRTAANEHTHQASHTRPLRRKHFLCMRRPPGTSQWLAALSHVTEKQGSSHTPRTTVPGITSSEPTGKGGHRRSDAGWTVAGLSLQWSGLLFAFDQLFVAAFLQTIVSFNVVELVTRVLCSEFCRPCGLYLEQSVEFR